ncbi:MAG: hypothetical protein HZB55_05455 [Deltaproteobacteria bacterium]|nr:hypothetical protein [Deltaproteobacteria bacterium]
MSSSESDARHPRFQLSDEASKALLAFNVVRDVDRMGHPHLLLKVPDLSKALEAEVGVEVARDEAGRVTVSVLLYDIPTEPVSYDLRCYPQDADDLRFLQSFLDAGQFRVHACAHQGEAWTVGPPQTFRLPSDVLLRLRHFAKDWPVPVDSAGTDEPAKERGATAAPQQRSPDPRDTVIRKLKEQVQALREQLQERDKRIIELEDELHEVRGRGRPYRLTGDKKPWWKPFS